MNITVAGLWHLGCVTSACCARHFQVTGLDFDQALVAGLQQGRAPILEPGLNELLNAGLTAKRLRFAILTSSNESFIPMSTSIRALSTERWGSRFKCSLSYLQLDACRVGSLIGLKCRTRH